LSVSLASAAGVAGLRVTLDLIQLQAVTQLAQRKADEARAEIGRQIDGGWRGWQAVGERALGAKALHGEGGDAEGEQLRFEGEHVGEAEQRGMQRGTHFVGEMAGEQKAQAFKRAVSAAFDAGDAGVVGKGGFYVEADPVEQGKKLREALGRHAGCVQRNAKTERANLADGIEQRGLKRGLAAGKDNGIEQADAAFQKLNNRRPAKQFVSCGRAQAGIVAVRTIPGAALAEERGGELAGPVASGETREPADTQVSHTLIQ